MDNAADTKAVNSNVVTVYSAPLWREQVGQALRNVRRDQRERLIELARTAGISP